MTEPHILYSGPIVTRKEAKSSGEKRYFTGTVCPHGHVSQRYVSGTACVGCLEQKRRDNPELNYEKVKAWRAKNPGARTEEARRYREKYPEKVAAVSLRWRHKHIDKVRVNDADRARNKRRQDPEGNRKRLRAFNERREAGLVEIAGRPRAEKCEVCLVPGKTVFDHCHNSGMFRGWICDRCNKTLGMVKDSPKLLKKLAKYLEANNVEVDIKGTKLSSDEGFFGSGSLISS